MEKITVEESTRLSSPHLFALAVTKNKEERLNIMGLSWFTFVSFNPGQILLSISRKSCTNANIKSDGIITLCMPIEEIKEQAFKCCTSSGNSVDKLKETGIELVEIEGFEIPAVKKSSVAWSLRVNNTIETGAQSIFIADIVSAVSLNDKKHLMAFDGYERLDAV